MKFKIKKIIFNLVLISILLIFSISIFAIDNDNNKQLMRIESDIQSLDMRKNAITFIGNVVVTYGSIKINADKIIITRLNNKKRTGMIDGYGNPTIFSQMQNSGELIKGHASKIHYEFTENIIMLIGYAYLEQKNSSISAEKISYLIKEKKMQAYSKKGQRITATLAPIYKNKIHQTLIKNN